MFCSSQNSIVTKKKVNLHTKASRQKHFTRIRSGLYSIFWNSFLLLSCFSRVRLCNPIDGFPVPGILQARILEWVAISFSNAWKWKVKVKSLSRVQLIATPWTAAHQAPQSMGFSRQEYWSGVPFWFPKITADGNCSHEIKTLTPLKESYDQPRQHIEKQRHYFANTGPSSQGYGFSSGHIWMWELDYKES